MTPSKKVALVTGSTSGIGLAIAERFLDDGMAVFFHGLERDGAEVAREAARKRNAHYGFSGADLRTPAGARELARDAAATLGRIDVLVNNAGMQHVAPIEDFPEEKWSAILAVNLSAAFFLSQAAWPAMRAAGWGRIVNVASVHGLRASEFKPAYVAAKHGLVGLTKALALEGAPHGITVNAICPGYVRTPLVDKQVAEQALAHDIPEREVAEKVFLRKQALKAFVPLEALAEMASFLAGDAARATTGASFVLDGGWTAQ